MSFMIDFEENSETFGRVLNELIGYTIEIDGRIGQLETVGEGTLVWRPWARADYTFLLEPEVVEFFNAGNFTVNVA